jgi:FkbM family methyltransferase
VSAIRLSLRGKIKGVVVKTAQGWFCLDPDEQFVSKSLLESGSYGLDEIERARQYLKPASKVLVVGAHIGTIAVPLSRLCAEVVAIEANPDTFEFLELNVRMNGCTNLSTYNVAANDKDEPLSFVMNTHNSGGSKRMPKMHDRAYFYDSPKVTSVPGVRLDEYLGRRDFDLVFMDIEGSEFFALSAMQNILAGAGTLIVEFLPHHLSRVAGITVEEFLRPIAGHFDLLHVPGSGARVEQAAFLRILQEMHDRGQGDMGLVFQKR